MSARPIKIKVAPKQRGQFFLSSGGGLWTTQVQRSYRMGVWPVTEQILTLAKGVARTGWTGRMRMTIEREVKSITDPVLGNIYAKTAVDYSKKVASLIEPAIAQSQANFRRQFVEKLALNGQASLTNMLTEYCSEATKILVANHDEAAQQVTRKPAMPPIHPPHTRAAWSFSAGKDDYHLYCLEYEPQKHNIYLFDGFYNLAFPWTIFLVLFKNGRVERPGEVSCTVCLFYSPHSLTSLNDPLFFNNLPHFWQNWAPILCNGGTLPEITIADPHWSDTFITWFWNSKFIAHGLYPLWTNATEQIPQVRNVKAWASLSVDEALRVPWLATGYDISRCVNGFQTDRMSKAAGTAQNKREEKFAALMADLRNRYGLRLQEEIAFLGARLVIPPETVKVIQASISEETEKLINDVDSRLSAMVNQVSKASSKIIAETVKQEEQEAVNVPNLD